MDTLMENLQARDARKEPNSLALLRAREVGKEPSPQRHDAIRELTSRSIRCNGRWQCHLAAVFCSIFADGDAKVVTGADDGDVKALQARNGKLIRRLGTHAGPVMDIQTNSDGSLVVSCGCDGFVSIWSVQAKNFGQRFGQAQLGSVPTCVKFVSDDLVVCAATDGNVSLIDLQQNAIVSSNPLVDEREERLSKLVYGDVSPGGRLIAMGSVKPACLIGLWRVQNKQLVQVSRLSGHTNNIQNVSFSPDGDRILSTSEDGTAKIFEMSDSFESQWSLVFSLRVPSHAKSNSRYRRRAASPKLYWGIWSRDGSRVVCAAADNKIHVFDPTDASLCHSLPIHAGSCIVVEPHPRDSALMLSAGFDGRVAIFDCKRGLLLRSFDHCTPQGKPSLLDAHWSSGSEIVATDSEGCLTIFGTDACEHFQCAKQQQFLTGPEFTPLGEQNRVSEGLLCDRDGIIYDDPYQSAFQQSCVFSMVDRKQNAPACTMPSFDVKDYSTPLNRHLPFRQPQEEDAKDSSAQRGTAQRWEAEINQIHTHTTADIRQEDVLQEDVQYIEEDDERDADFQAAQRLGTAQDYESDFSSDDNEEENEPGSAQPTRTVRTRGVKARYHREVEYSAEMLDDMDEQEELILSEEENEIQEGDDVTDDRARRRKRRRMQAHDIDSERPRRKRKKRKRIASRTPREDNNNDNHNTEGYEGNEGQHRPESYGGEEEQEGREEEEAAPDVESAEVKAKIESRAQMREQHRSRSKRQLKRPRHPDCYAWLHATTQTVGVQYIPQLADDVVFVPEGFEGFLESVSDQKTERPHDVMPMRAAEPAKVVRIHYQIAEDGSERTFANITMILSDPTSPSCGKCVELQLSSMEGHPEFLCLQGRYDQALARNWHPGKHGVTIFWLEEQNMSESWACIVEDILEERPLFPESPYKRMRVQYVDDDGRPLAGQVAEEEEVDDHSVWELFDRSELPESEFEMWRCGIGQLSEARAEQIRAKVDECRNNDDYQLFHTEPPPDTMFTGIAYNSRVAFPLGLSTISDRLEHGFYRQVEGYVHDVHTIRDNAILYTGEVSNVTDLAETLMNELLQPLSDEERERGERLIDNALIERGDTRQIEYGNWVSEHSLVLGDMEIVKAGH